MKVHKYQRGQIWLYENNQTYDGSVQGKTRPVIIVSNNKANENSNSLLVVPCTTASKRYMPTHIEFKIEDTNNTALAENLMSVNIQRLKKYIGTVDTELLEKLEDCIKIALGLKAIPTSNIEQIQKMPLIPVPDIKIPKIEPNIIVDLDNSVLDIKSDLNNPLCINNPYSIPVINYDEVKEKSKANYTLNEKIRFVNDYENHNVDYMLKKYNIGTESSLKTIFYQFRKQVREAEEEN